MVRKRILILFLVFSLSFPLKAHAALPTFDAVNAALSELRNSILQTGFLEEMRVALEKLEQLKATYQEMLRVNAGWDELMDHVLGDPLKKIFSKEKEITFENGGGSSSHPLIRLFDEARDTASISRSLQKITGQMPDTKARPYIAFDEIQVIRGFEYAKEIQEEGKKTKEAGEKIAELASTASPKGAQRLAAQALGKLIVVEQENQEALGKLIELNATQVEQVSRDEKRLETARLTYMQEMEEAVQSLGRVD